MDTVTYEGAADLQSSAAGAVLEPSAPNGAGSALECAACGHVGLSEGRGQCARCKAFLRGNVAGMTHGGRREHPVANPEDSELFKAWERDLGGDLTAGQRAVLSRIVEADAVCQSALDYVLRTREALVATRVQKALAVLGAAAGTVFTGARLLGLERRPRDAESISEYVTRKAAEAREGEAEP